MAVFTLLCELGLLLLLAGLLLLLILCGAHCCDVAIGSAKVLLLSLDYHVLCDNFWCAENNRRDVLNRASSLSLVARDGGLLSADRALVNRLFVDGVNFCSCLSPLWRGLHVDSDFLSTSEASKHIARVKARYTLLAHHSLHRARINALRSVRDD